MEAATYAAIGADVDQKCAAYEEVLARRLAAGVCPSGHVNPIAQKFCGECGQLLPEHDPSADAAYEAARAAFVEARASYRLVGEREGFRVGPVVVEDNDGSDQ